ncbi:MAG TPA: head-tail connector protein [Mycobacterium sp.]|nr:head-tail connector protein [Mycobacterium sp.]
MSVLSRSAAKDHLNLQGSSDDAELQLFIEAAEAGVARRVGPLTAGAVTERVRGCCRVLQLGTTPVISLTSISPAVGLGGAPVSLSSLFVTPGGQVESTIGITFWLAFYDVVYQAGRSVVDPDLLHGIKETVRHLWETQRPAGARRPTVGPGGELLSSDRQELIGAAYSFTTRAKEMFGPHTQMVIGGA